MKCSKCNGRFIEGEGLETVTGFTCWACSVADEVAAKLQAPAVEEEEAFATLSTNELVAAGYIDAATMDELFAPWESEHAIAA